MFKWRRQKAGFKQVLGVFGQVLCRICSTEKRSKAGRANFQHQGLTGKRNK